MFTKMLVRTYFKIYKQGYITDNLCPSNKIRSRVLFSDVH